MKNIIIICILILNGCSSMPPENEVERQTNGDYKIKIIDSCEYIEFNWCVGADIGVYSLTHKGNCKFCKQRAIKP